MRDLRSPRREEAAGLQNRRVVDPACDDMAWLATRANSANQAQIVSFGTAGSKDDFFGFGADQGRNLRAGGLHCLASNTSFVMQARWISKRSGEKWGHLIEHAGIEWGRCGMIEINSRTHSASPVLTAPSLPGTTREIK